MFRQSQRCHIGVLHVDVQFVLLRLAKIAQQDRVASQYNADDLKRRVRNDSEDIISECDNARFLNCQRFAGNFPRMDLK